MGDSSKIRRITPFFPVTHSARGWLLFLIADEDLAPPRRPVFFFWSALLTSDCFCEDSLLWFDFGDLSPIIFIFLLAWLTHLRHRSFPPGGAVIMRLGVSPCKGPPPNDFEGSGYFFLYFDNTLRLDRKLFGTLGLSRARYGLQNYMPGLPSQAFALALVFHALHLLPVPRVWHLSWRWCAIITFAAVAVQFVWVMLGLLGAIRWYIAFDFLVVTGAVALLVSSLVDARPGGTLNGHATLSFPKNLFFGGKADFFLAQMAALAPPPRPPFWR